MNFLKKENNIKRTVSIVSAIIISAIIYHYINKLSIYVYENNNIGMNYELLTKMLMTFILIIIFYLLEADILGSTHFSFGPMVVVAVALLSNSSMSDFSEFYTNELKKNKIEHCFSSEKQSQLKNETLKKRCNKVILSDLSLDSSLRYYERKDFLFFSIYYEIKVMSNDKIVSEDQGYVGVFGYFIRPLGKNLDI